MSHSSNITIKQLKGAEAGRRAFILANGPSVAKENLSFLKDELVIGMNASTLLEKQHGFESKYYVVSDMRFLSHPVKRVWGTADLSPKTIRVLRRELHAVDEPSLASRTVYVDALSRDGFSTNLAVGFFYACTTTMLAVQLAYYLGVKEIYLLGVDLRYPSDNPRFYTEANPQVEDAFTSVQIANLMNAKKLCAERGVGLHNCSSVSLLRPYLGHVPFASLFEKEAA